jgi:hypothetical protein
VGAGMMSKEINPVRENGHGRVMTADLIWNAGVFYDRNGSLQASFLVSGSRAYKVKVNVFPGIVHVPGASPWMFAALGQENEVIAGFGLAWIPAGLAVQR